MGYMGSVSKTWADGGNKGANATLDAAPVGWDKRSVFALPCHPIQIDGIQIDRVAGGRSALGPRAADLDHVRPGRNELGEHDLLVGGARGVEADGLGHPVDGHGQVAVGGRRLGDDLEAHPGEAEAHVGPGGVDVLVGASRGRSGGAGGPGVEDRVPGERTGRGVLLDAGGGDQGAGHLDGVDGDVPAGDARGASARSSRCDTHRKARPSTRGSADRPGNSRRG